MSQTEREQFEKWYTKEYPSAVRLGALAKYVSGGDYMSQETASEFRAYSTGLRAQPPSGEREKDLRIALSGMVEEAKSMQTWLNDELLAEAERVLAGEPRREEGAQDGNL